MLFRSTDPGSRYFLVKQGKDVVVARIDLSGMDDVINVLSARAETVSILDEVRANETSATRDQNVLGFFHFSAAATASASFWRYAALSIFSASAGLER